jgi:hypothetical protein
VTIRFFTDEDVYGSIAPALRGCGYDAVSTPEAGRIGESDDSQLAWAASQGYVLVSFNVGHFASRHVEWLQGGRRHHGIVVSQQRPIGEVLRGLISLAKSLDAEAMLDRLEFVGDWLHVP